MRILKSQVLDHFRSVTGAAEFFGITPQAVSQWEDGPIPELRETQLQLRLPHVFGNGVVNERVAA